MICRHLLQHDDCIYCLREQVAALRAQLSDALDVIDAIEQGVSVDEVATTYDGTGPWDESRS